MSKPTMQSAPSGKQKPERQGTNLGASGTNLAGEALGSAAAIHLTEGEHEVLLDISVGLTDQAIARRLSLSRRGVQNRLASIYRKLGVHRSAQQNEPLPCAPRCRAVFLALRIGLIQTDEMAHREMGHRDWLAASGAA